MMGRYGQMNFLRIPKEKDKHVVQESLERVKMWEFRDRQIGELSGGQRNASSSPARWRRRAASCSSTNPSPAST